MTSSCENNCGKVNKYNDLITNQRCFCDKLCLIFDDCCSDFVEFCPEEAALGNNIIETKFSGSVNSSMVVSVLSLLDYSKHKVIAFCPSDLSACEPPPSYFERMINDVPVLDLDTGIDYVNAKCAKCNNVTNGQYWEATVICEDYPSKINIPKEPMTPDSVQTLLNVTNGQCWLELDISQYRPQEMQERKHVPILHFCSQGCMNERFVNACLNGPPEHVTLIGTAYHNPYCALCIYWQLWPKMEERLECRSYYFNRDYLYSTENELMFTTLLEYNQTEHALVLPDKNPKHVLNALGGNATNGIKTYIRVEDTVLFVFKFVFFSVSALFWT